MSPSLYSSAGLHARFGPFWPVYLLVPSLVVLIFLSAGFCFIYGRLNHGHYPAPLTRSGGYTAAEWGETAKDADHMRCWNASFHLKDLGSEAIPFLIEAAESQNLGRRFENTLILSPCRGALADKPDLWRIAAFLDVEAMSLTMAAFQAKPFGYLAKLAQKARRWFQKSNRLPSIQNLAIRPEKHLKQLASKIAFNSHGLLK